MELFGVDIRIYFLLFIIYSVIGWCMEVTLKLIESRKFVNRGFLIGPYCPIYGYGAILITFLLKKYTNDVLTLFIMAILVCGILEYVTSYFMEKIFKARWWDYSKNKFNINGRVCLETIIPFGLLGLLIMYVTNPFFLAKLQQLPETWLNILFWAILAVFITDNIVSTVVISYIKKALKFIGKELDSTEEITKKIREVLRQKSPLHRRLANAYPKLEAVKLKIKQKKEEIKEQLEEQKKEVIEHIKEQKEEIKQQIAEQKIEIGKIIGETSKKVEKIANNIKNKEDSIKYFRGMQDYQWIYYFGLQ